MSLFRHIKPYLPLIAAVGILLLNIMDPQPAWATQDHGGREGLHAHQIAHLFFLCAMGLLIFWLKQKQLENQAGWNWIQLSALFFMLWNADAFLVHFLETTPELIRLLPESAWHLRMETSPGWEWIGYVYYLAKLDHLLTLPAMIFLFLGLRKLSHGSAGPGTGGKTG